MSEEEEVLFEIEAVQAVYGDDCVVIQRSPPHLNVHIRPRTADDSSQQFVEAVLGIQANSQYPKAAPHIHIMESKGLDEKRQLQLVTCIQDKARELSSCLMLVALCEEAMEIISNMNHPEGDCPLCLYPLLQEDKSNGFLPFMKLMSCFHCFHSECIMRWWMWLQEQTEINAFNQTGTTASYSVENQRGMHTRVNQQLGNCPVCRKVFHSKDIEHVADLLGNNSTQKTFEGIETTEYEKAFLQSDMENSRREKYEALLKLQQENSGLIEPKRDLVILPGMFLPESITAHTTTSMDTSVENCGDNDAREPIFDTDINSSSSKPTTSMHMNSSTRRKSSVHHPRKYAKAHPSKIQWIKKEKDTPNQ